MLQMNGVISDRTCTPARDGGPSAAWRSRTRWEKRSSKDPSVPDSFHLWHQKTNPTRSPVAPFRIADGPEAPCLVAEEEHNRLKALLTCGEVAFNDKNGKSHDQRFLPRWELAIPHDPKKATGPGAEQPALMTGAASCSHDPSTMIHT